MDARRRRLLSAAGIAIAAPAAWSQSPSRRRVAVADFEGGLYGRETIKQALGELGWREGENVEFREVRTAEALTQLGRHDTDLIMAFGSLAASAAAREHRLLPIVFAAVPSRIASTLVAPGNTDGNITGVTTISRQELFAKRVELLRQLAPKARRLAWIRQPNRTSSSFASERSANAPVAAKLGFELRSYETSLETIDAQVAQLRAWRAQAIVLGEIGYGTRTLLVEYALRDRIPMAGDDIEFIFAGGLVGYDVKHDDFARLVAKYVDYVLRGRSPRDLAIATPSEYRLMINARTARAIGLKVPEDLLLRADFIYE